MLPSPARPFFSFTSCPYVSGTRCEMELSLQLGHGDINVGAPLGAASDLNGFNNI